MYDKYYELLRELQTQMEEEYKTVRKAVNRPTWPQLMITKSRSRTDFLAVMYSNGERVKRYIKKDPERIYRLAHKAYMREYALRLRQDMEVVNAAAKAMKPLDYGSMLESLPKHFDLLDPELVMAPGKRAANRAYPNPSPDVPPVEARLELWDKDAGARPIPGYKDTWDKDAGARPIPGYKDTWDKDAGARLELWDKDAGARPILGYKDTWDKDAGERLELWGKDAWEWAAEPYCENTDHPESKTHLTREGVRCRSKSEALIFGIYMSLGLPFHYDQTVTIGGRRISPDFIGVRRDGRFVYHEHCGLSSEQYRARSDRKAWLYASAGIYQGDNLIFTFDDPNGNINAKLAEALIRDAYKL